MAVGSWDGEPSSSEYFSRILAECSFEELEEAALQLHNVKTAADARLCAVIGEIAERRAYLVDGCRDMASWLVARLNVNRHNANACSKVGTALRSLPQLAGMFSSAEICFDQLAPIARVATAENEAELAELIVSYSAGEAEVLAQRLSSVPASDERDAHRKRHLSLREVGHEMRISGRLPVFEGEKVKLCLSGIAEEYGPDPETGTYDPFSIRMVDALVDLASGSLAAETDADKATVIVHLDPDVLSGTDGPVETGGGAFVPAETARRAACDSRIQTWSGRQGSRQIDIGRLSRTIPSSLRNYIRRRDLVCRLPGCGRTRLCEGHHIVFWGAGGATDKANLVVLCRLHHHLLHEGGWHVDGDPEHTSLTFVSPLGRRLTSTRVPFPDEIRQCLFAETGRAGP
jgi:hypothetical protein